MREQFLKFLACPKCQGDIIISEVEKRDGDRIETGSLACAKCAATYPIINFIPRFVSVENYADNFGFQWNQYAATQYDSSLGLPMSESRFYITTNWPKKLDGELVLEAGCGAGRFTEVVLTTGATMVSFDYSSAVEANYKMNGQNQRLLIVQADIFSPPVKAAMFDRLYCMGVLQHTPNPEKAFRSLPRFLKPGGSIAIDVYLKEGLWKWLTSYRRLRWITRYLSAEKINAISKVYVDLTWPITKWLWSFGKAGRRIARYVFLMKDRFWRKGLNVSDEVQKESLVLHLIDQLCAYHDKPQSPETVRYWFESENITDIKVFKGGNGVIGRGRVR